ncbi:SPOR domain-containing protein [Erythrobacter sp. SCSIO 43205]|uniref:SPOR domain-containing protein n=1 Tax=Erythrobacter sp. SCSIO 43205 TaxID=2779361 RepID=UPI001CA99DA4|nr:SPOR domain-containing protein [Erythrobacter sp. SCSIO 43205]UAB79038.1 SPOR domain-containing protein [Erythrobacter sp. SCSIO 43205]
MARHSSRTSGPKLGLIMGSALASLALASCASSAPPAQVSFTKAENALAKGNVDKAVSHAEAAVLASPRDPEYRAILGSAYLEAGRFASAATAFGDAMELGDSRGRTVLSYALAKTAIGDNAAAVRELQARQNSVPRADLGLALALAGEAERGVQILIESIREGSTSPKSRQNLAYAYALAGNWRAARVMAAEDVPADQLDARLSDWAASARPEDHMLRVSTLLGLKPVNDAGQPQHLALANFPAFADTVAEVEQLASAEPAPVAAPKAAANPAPVKASAPAPRESEAMAMGLADYDGVTGGDRAPTPARAAAPAPAPSVAAVAPKPAARRFVSNEVVQATPKPAAAPAPRAAAPKPAPTRTAPTRTAQASAPKTGAADTHLIQLGAFNSREVAEAKWKEFQRRYPALRGHDAVFTEAEVNGRTFFRVAAAGFGARDARSVCGSVKRSGGGCFAYAKSSPPAGAVKSGVRVAAR